MKGGKLPCGCLTFQQQVDNTFKLELDKTKLTIADAGRHDLYITVKDEWFRLFFTKNMYVIGLVIEYEEKIVIQAVVELEAAAEAAIEAAKPVDTFVAPVDNTTVKVVVLVGEVIGASTPPTPTVSAEEMTNVLDEYAKELEDLQRSI